MSTWALAAMLAALSLQQTPPVAAADPQDSTSIEGLVVNAPPRLAEKEVVQKFVESVAVEAGNGRLGRWDRKICPGIVGLSPEYAQFVADRIAVAALKVGLQVGEPGCQANLLVMVTGDSDGFVRNALKNSPNVFAKYDRAQTSGRKALKAFETSKAPVRWWQVTARVLANGKPYNDGGQVRVEEVSRLRSTTRADFERAIVVVDAKRIGTIRFGALADYIAFVGLAQVDPEVDISGAPSILNLFNDRDAGREPVSGLTDWDNAYLEGLYSARRNTMTSDGQKDDVARSMTGELSATPKP